MEQEVFVVIRQSFYVDNGTHYQLADDNPVIIVCRSKVDVDDFIRHRLRDLGRRGYTYEHLDHLSSTGLIEKYIIKDCQGRVIRAYSVIKEYVL